MALRFLIGTSGSGKTHCCMQEILAATQNKRNILLVPEQFTSQAERDLTSIATGKAILHTEVLSFGRLAYQIFSKSGQAHTTFFNDIGKQMALQKILLTESEQISFFRHVMDKNGFLDQLSLTLTELFQYQISPEVLSQLAQQESLSHNAQQKCQDLSYIYRCYLDFLQNDMISQDETLSYLAEKLKTSNDLIDTEIWVDGFYGFTPQEYSVLSQLLRICKRVTIALPMDRNSYDASTLPPYAPFFEPFLTKKELVTLAEENGIAIESPVILTKNHRTQVPALRFLEQHYFHSYAKKSEDATGISICACGTKEDEITYTAGKIISLVREKQIRFRDIAIVTNALGTYENSLRAILKEYDIPYFIDTRRDMTTHPLVALIQGLLDCIRYDFPYQSIFTYLKSGLTPMEQEDMDVLENYVLAYGIKGYKWKKDDWTYGIKPEQEEEHEYINHLRKQVMQPFTAFLQYKNKKEYPLRSFVCDLLNQLDQLGVAQRLTMWAEQAEQSGYTAKADEHRQIWQVLMELLQTAVDIFGDTPLTLEDFSKILSAGLTKSSMGIIPPTADCLLVGDLERSRLPNIRVLFVLGVNDGVLPAPAQSQGIFSESERESIQNAGIALAPDGKRKLFEEQFLIYRGLTKPSEELYLTYATADITGKALFPSSLISRLQQMYPTLEIESNDNIQISSLSPVDCFHQLGKNLRNYIEDAAQTDPMWLDIYSYFTSKTEWKDRLQLIQNALLAEIPEGQLSKEIAKSLYGKNILSSISRLERFAACPFSFFAEYGLKATPRRFYELHTPDLGTLFHMVLEQFSIRLKEDQLSWHTLTQEETERRIEDAVDAAVPQLGNEILLDSAANRYLVQRLKRIAKRAGWTLVRHIQSGDFVPHGYEVGFGPQELLPPIIIKMADGSRLILRGQIDRVDLFDANGNRYVKIIDYKSGNKTFQLQDIYYGLQLQLLLYLDAYLKENDTASMPTHPGGAFYFHVADPSISVSNEISEGELNDMLYKEMRMSGLILDDPATIQAMDHAFIDEETGDFCYTSSDIIPLQYTKKGKPTVSSLLASETEYRKMMSFAAKRAATLGQSMKDGMIAPTPYRKKNITPCTYCAFATICRYDYKDHPQYRDLKKITWEDILTQEDSQEL